MARISVLKVASDVAAATDLLIPISWCGATGTAASRSTRR
jgi:hypothetical protein